MPTKIQGLANLRIGYGLAKAELIDVLQKTRQPFNTNGIAQAGALAGLLDEEHQRKTREITIEGRDFLQREFASLGLDYVPSFANFVLVCVGDGKADQTNRVLQMDPRRRLAPVAEHGS